MASLTRAFEKALRLLRREAPILPGELDVAELPALLGRDDPVILDIGCNDGYHTLRFLELFRHARVYAFEPDPRAQERFRHNVRDERAKLFELAISAVDGEVDFHMSDGHPSASWREQLPGGWDLSGSIRTPKAHRQLHPWCTFDQQVKVRTRRLDSWCAEEGIGAIDLIWADVQGAEVDLIDGGRSALARTRWLYTEYSDRELYEGQITLAKMLALLPDFRVVKRFPNDVLLRNAGRPQTTR